MAELKMSNTLADILSGDADPLGLLKGVEPAKRKVTPKSPVELNFQEIVDFYTATGHAPDINAPGMRERQLAARLKAYRSRPALRGQALAFDSIGLLSDISENTGPALCVEKKAFDTLDAIFNSDPVGLLSGIDSSILKIEHVTQQSPDDRNWPDEIASRKPCEDFFNFEKLMRDTQRDIINHKISTARFKNETQVEVGDFFILSGLICFVDSILDENEGGKRDNPRLRVIFENGLETNILKRSLSRALYKDPNGRRIVPSADTVTNRMTGITHKDKATGCIYILASQTKSPALADLKLQGRLVKIGYSSQDVHERVKNAETEPTYLEAPVTILASLDCYNLNPQKVEHLIHAFLSKQRINMTLISSKGKPYKPTEWFAVDRNTAIAVAEHIVKGDIMNYRMDNTTGHIKKLEVVAS